MPSDMSKWATIIGKFDDIPNCFRRYLEPGLNNDDLPYVILAPEYRWGRRKTNEKMIYIYEERINYIERNNQGIIHKVYLLSDVIQIEHGKVLLYSWIKISAYINGMLDFFVVEYNTVTEPLFIRVINTIRTSVSTQNPFIANQVKINTAKIDLLEYKFKNYIQYCLLPGSEIISFVFQEEIRKRYLGFFYKNISPTHLVLLTDKELIIIKEDNKMTKSTRSYGQIYHYVPLEKIKLVKVNRDSGADIITLEIQLIHEAQVLIKYEPYQEYTLSQMKNLFH